MGTVESIDIVDFDTDEFDPEAGTSQTDASGPPPAINVAENVATPVQEGTPQNIQEETPFDCPICCEKIQPADSFRISGCGHRFCKACLNRWYTSKVDEGCLKITCPFITNNGVCGVPVLRERLNEVIHIECYSRYERLRKLKQNENARECPFCQYIQVGDPKFPNMKCNKCLKEYCFTHSNAHVGKTCKQYEKQNKREFKKSMRAAKKGSKICPGCGAVVSKIDGCNHMTCRCGMDFCNICGADITGNVGGHYIFGCNQYDQDILKGLLLDGEYVSNLSVLVWRILYALYTYIVYGPIVIATMLAITPLYFLYTICTCKTRIPCGAFLLRWARMAEGIFVALLAFCIAIPSGVLSFLLCFPWKYRLSWKTCEDATVYTIELTRYITVGVIAFMNFLLMLPMLICLCCCSCCGVCFAIAMEEDPWFAEIEFERDIIQVPFLALYGMDALEHWDEAVDAIFQPF